MKYFLICLCLFISLKVFTQAQNNTWIFGTNAGLDFNTTPPQPIVSSLIALEGTASVSDVNGDLLFYTNGVTIWDQNGNPMPNGDNLLGGSSSTQAALIVPMPNSCKKYYVFTTEDHMGSGTIRYTVVDMCLNNGLGDVITSQKNILMTSNVTEKLTSVLHSNNSDVWILGHYLSNNEFFAFKLTSTGVTSTPVVSSVGAVYSSMNYIGPMKASPDGNMIAASTTFGTTFCELFNFNKTSGVLTYNVNVASSLLYGNSYGLEFSPDGSKLYVSTCWGTSSLSQYNIATGTATLLSTMPGDYQYGALQLANDGRIYMARNYMGYLGVINNPNVTGMACNYVDNGITLAPGASSTMGLPNFSPFTLVGQQPVANLISDSIVYYCSPFQVNINLDCNATISWNTGSTSANYTISGPGTYVVTLNNSCTTIIDTIEVVQSSGGTTMSLPEDTAFCTFPAQGFTITPTVTGSSPSGYTWSTGSTASSITVFSSGTYWLQVATSCGVQSDTIVIGDSSPPVITLPDSLEVCSEDFPVNVSATVSNYNSIQWTEGETTQTITVNSPGTYTIQASNDCETISDSIVVFYKPAPYVSLIGSLDTCLQSGQTVTLIPVYSDVDDVLWSTGATSNQLAVSTSGFYMVYASSSCGVDSASCSVQINTFPELYLPATLDTCFEIGVGFSYTANGTTGSYSWSTGSNSPTVNIYDEGTYTCTLTNQCGSVSASMVVNRMGDIDLVVPNDSVLFCSHVIPWSELHIETNYNLYVENEFGIQTGTTIDETGWYYVTGYNACGSLTDSIYVDLGKDALLYLPNTFTPNTDLINDIYVYKGQDLMIIEVDIFNRWGEVVYTESGQFTGWDGTYRGNECPDGVYSVKVVYMDCFGIETEFHGSISLLR